MKRLPLHTIHNLRLQRRDKAERDLARAINEVAAAAVAKVEEAVQLRAASAEAYAATLQPGVFDPHEMIARAGYLTTLARRESEARTRLAAIEQAREAQREITLAAARDSQVTAKLRERHQARQAAEAALAEQNMLDEMATIAVARRSMKKT